MERIRFTLTIKTVALSHGESINASFLEEMILSLISSAFADTISKWFSPHNDRIVESNSRSVPKTNIQRKRKRPDDKKPGPDTNERKVKKRQRLIWYPPKPPLTSNQLAAKYRADILDDKFSKNWGSIGGKRPQDFGPIRKPPVPLPKRLPLHPIEWFDSNVFSTYQSQKCDRKGYPLRIEKFKAKVLKLEKRVDLCLKSSCWSDIEIPRLMYISMRKIIVGIVRIFYDNGYTDLHKTLSGHSGTISQPVREALSASKLMNVLQHHFVNHPSFRHELSVERALIIREERIKANLKITPRTRRYQVLDFRRKHVLDACSNTDYDSIRNQIVKAHTGQILARMRDDQDHLVELSKSLKSSMKDHMEILCRLAYNYGMIIKTHDQVWQTHTSPTGCEVPTAFVDVVGDIEGHVCQGFSNRYIVALNVFPALFCSREENPANMGLVEKSWVVADRL